MVSVCHERVEVVNACVANKVPAVERHGVRKIVGGSQGVKTPRTSQIFVLVVSVKSGATSVPRWVAQTTGATWIVNAASWIGQRQRGECVDECLVVPRCIPAWPNVEEEAVQA